MAFDAQTNAKERKKDVTNVNYMMRFYDDKQQEKGMGQLES